MDKKIASILQLTQLSDIINAIRYARFSRQIRSWMTMTPSEMEQFQLKRLQEIVTHAYTTVELYHHKWQQAGITPEDIKTLDDINKLPIITRDDFRHSPVENILSRRFKPHEYFTAGTSGSSGSPLKMFVDNNKALLDLAVDLPRHMAGQRPMTIFSGLRDFFLRKDIRFMAIIENEQLSYESLYSRIFSQMKHTLIDSALTPSEHIAAINTKRPICLMTYPSTLRNICLEIKAGKPLTHQPQLIMFTAEVLDQPLREMIKNVFQAELMDIYAATETGFMAAECSAHNGQHILAWKVIMELLDEKGQKVHPEQSGRVVITDLFNRATPIIRYAGLGDYAIRKIEPCDCGSSLPRLANIDGRFVDSVILPNGRIVHPYVLTQILNKVPNIGKFQIRQEKLNYVQVLIVKDTHEDSNKISFAPNSKFGQIIIQRFEQLLGKQIKVDLKTVADIPKRAGSHKFATVLSLVDNNHFS